MGSMETRVWFFQANPAHYDIDAALAALDRLWWRVPQHTYEIRAGDVAVLWRSGKRPESSVSGESSPILNATRWTRLRGLSSLLKRKAPRM
jgi:hypothetical protein